MKHAPYGVVRPRARAPRVQSVARRKSYLDPSPLSSPGKRSAAASKEPAPTDARLEITIANPEGEGRFH